MLLLSSSQTIDLVTGVAMLLLWIFTSASSSVYSSTWYLVAAWLVNSTETEVEVQRHIAQWNAVIVSIAIVVLLALRLWHHPPAWALQFRAWIIQMVEARSRLLHSCCRRMSRVAASGVEVAGSWFGCSGCCRRGG